MPILSYTASDYPFQPGNKIFSSSINTNFNDVATFLNTTLLDSTNIQNAGIATSNIANSAITTALIADTNVTLGKLATPVQNALAPSGAIIATGSTSAPTGWLLCNGAAVSRTTYAALFTAIGTNFGYGDNSSTFNLPDFRGRFLRMVDGGLGRDPDYASRTAMATGGASGDNVGSIQGAQSQLVSHTHTATDSGHAHNYYWASASGGGNKPTMTNPSTNDNSGTYGPYSTESSTASITVSTASNSNDTRPTNAYIQYIIKT